MIKRFSAARSTKARVRALRRCAMPRGWIGGRLARRSAARLERARAKTMAEIRALGIVPSGLWRKSHKRFTEARLS